MYRARCSILFFLILSPVQAQSAAPSAEPARADIAAVRGHAGTVAINGRAARRDQSLAVGDRIEVEPTGWVCMKMRDGGSLLLARNPEESLGPVFQIQTFDPAGGRLAVAVARGLLLYDLPEDRAKPLILSVNCPATEMATRSGKGLIFAGSRGDRVVSREGSAAVRARLDGKSAAVPAGQGVIVTSDAGLGVPAAWSWQGFLNAGGPAVLGVESCLEAPSPTASPTVDVSIPLEPPALDAERLKSWFRGFRQDFPKLSWAFLLLPLAMVVRKILSRLKGLRSVDNPCRFCKRAMKHSLKFYQLGEIDAEKVWIRLQGMAPLAIIQGLQAGSERAAKEAEPAAVRFEVQHLFCSPCTTGELVLERRLPDSSEVRRVSLRGEAFKRMF